MVEIGSFRFMKEGVNRFLSVWLYVVGLVLSSVMVSADSGADVWIFEGLVRDAAPELSPAVKDGYVFSGSFQYDNDLADPVTTDSLQQRFDGGLNAIEVTLDINHVVQFEGRQRVGGDGLTIINDDPNADGRDFLGFDLPLESQALQSPISGLMLKWAQIWLFDSEGNMVNGSANPMELDSIDWKSGWFRLTFLSENGQSFLAEGNITRFGRYGDEPTVQDQINEYESIIVYLSDQLASRDSLLSQLQLELEGAEGKIEGLRQMVDYLVLERSELQNRNKDLEERLEFSEEDSDVRESLLAEKAILESELQMVQEKNRQLETELSRIETSFEVIQDESPSSGIVSEPKTNFEKAKNIVEADQSQGTPEPESSFIIVEEPIQYEVIEPEIDVGSDSIVIRSRDIESKENDSRPVTIRRKGPRGRSR